MVYPKAIDKKTEDGQGYRNQQRLKATSSISQQQVYPVSAETEAIFSVPKKFKTISHDIVYKPY